VKWRFTLPGTREKMYTKERNKKISEGQKIFFTSGSDSAKRQIARLVAMKPMQNEDSKQRMRLTKVLNGTLHRAPIQGGNGKPIPIPVQMLLDVLGQDWKPEHAVSLGKRIPNYPTNYKFYSHNDSPIGVSSKELLKLDRTVIQSI
jgi:hypothetical protein